jgi:hypothetical protein
LTTLLALGEGLFTAEDRLRLPGGVLLPIRTTVVRLSDGGVLVHSPTSPRAELVEAVAALGPVRALVAPNLLHHLWVGAWQERFPEAKLWAAPGVARKRRELRVAETLGEATPPWADVFAPLPLAGCPTLAEHVFFHATSRTLVCSDLLFNIRTPETWATSLVLRLAGTRGRLAMSRAWWRYAQDRVALWASLERALAWDFARVLVGHGEVFEAADAPARCREAFARVLPPRP